MYKPADLICIGIVMGYSQIETGALPFFTSLQVMGKIDFLTMMWDTGFNKGNQKEYN